MKLSGGCQVKSIEILGESFRYVAHVGPGLIGNIGELARALVSRRRCAVIADEVSDKLYGQRTADALAGKDFQVTRLTIPSGERSKSMTQVQEVCEQMAAAGLDRSSFAVGLGGGVVGDVSGFAAAVFHRGIPHMQVPTTLLGMVDSAIGGKTGVNLGAGKNLIGAIHHPLVVIADTETLATLPSRELRQGHAEIVKHAIIRDREMFRSLEQRRTTDWVALISRNIAIKATIVAADDHDRSGQRAVLNFGHTIGHAIEQASNFEMPHGDCVSLGMVAACEISVRRAGLPQNERDQIASVLARLGLPVRLSTDLPRDKVRDAIWRDKKFEGGQIRFVVTPRIGEAYVSREVTMHDIRAAIESL